MSVATSSMAMGIHFEVDPRPANLHAQLAITSKKKNINAIIEEDHRIRISYLSPCSRRSMILSDLMSEQLKN